MKKIYLSFAVLGALSFNTMAQLPTKAKKDISFYKGDMKSRISPIAQQVNQKAPGDTIWENNFTVSDKWLMTSLVATQGAQFGWKVSNSATPPAIGTKINSTSDGKYAVVWNGNPGQTHVANAEFIMMYDSTFNLSTYGAIDFKFEQYGALFTDKQVVEASVDDGTTWVELGNNDDMGMLTAGGGSAYPNSTKRTYKVKAAFPGGTDFSAVKFRFRVYWTPDAGANSGIMYGWYVDDVQLVETLANDLNLYQAFNVVGPQQISYTKFPVGQVTAATTTSFGAIVKNDGTDSQDVTVSVSNSAGAIDASDELSIAGFSSDSLEITGPYAIPSTVGVYNFTYTATSSNSTLQNTANDSKVVPFEVSPNVMAADAFNNTAQSITGSFFGWANGSGDAEIGTFFEIFADDEVGAIQIGIANVNSGDQADYIGRTITGKIYKMSSGGEPTIIDATVEHILAAGEFGKIIKAYFMSPVALEAGSLYLVTASLLLDSEIPVAFSGFVPDGNVAGFNGTTFSGLIANEVYGNVVECPVVRLDFNDYTGVEELEAAQFNVNAYPNPFSATTEVAFELKNESSVSIKVTDVTGREVLNLGTVNYTAGAHTVSINGADLNAGIYNISMTVGNNVVTKRIVKK